MPITDRIKRCKVFIRLSFNKKFENEGRKFLLYIKTSPEYNRDAYKF